MADRFLAVDWGTTNRRVYLIEAGAVIETRRDDRGVVAMAGGDWPAEVAAMRERYGDLPVLIAGMAGSNRGWVEAPYVECPAGLDALADRIAWVEPGRTGIVAGVCQSTPDPDVMRGEEVQLLGAVAAGLVPADARLCQPGTHCKWAELAGGAIASFATAMTGEVFALLKAHSLLAPQLAGEVADNADFREGVRRATRGDLTTALFGIRAATLLGHRPAEASAAYASGLLIGHDVAARAIDGDAVHILADRSLGDLYAAAVDELGGTPHVVDSHAAFVAGITALQERLS